MKLSKLIVLTTVALSASFASANCKDANQDALNRNRAKSQHLAQTLTNPGTTHAPTPQNEQGTGAQGEG